MCKAAAEVPTDLLDYRKLESDVLIFGQTGKVEITSYMLTRHGKAQNG